jgi:4'-phosphopantetheinyl transferase
MPFCQYFNLPNNIHSLIWHIKETELKLLAQLPINAIEFSAYQKLSHPRRRLEWIAVRLAMQALCKGLNYPYYGITKSASGKPFLINSSWHISLAHNFPFAFAAISAEVPIGIDIQFIHPKLSKLASKYLNFSEEQAIKQDLEALAIYWSAKEAIYKTYGSKRLSFKHDITIKPFSKLQQGILHGVAAEHHFIIHYALISKHVLVWCQPQ